MKVKPLFLSAFGLIILAFFISILAMPLRQVPAQEMDNPDPSDKFSREELAQMLAPIALYPDVLLAQVLMASTYPIEVIEADRWVKKNPGLKGEALDHALLEQDWDPSIKAISHFPSILSLMSERITETTNLGNAFLTQEAEVMDMVQELRAKAYAQNNLNTDSRQKVIVERETIIIEPADPKVIYVSYYDPLYVFGPWWFPAYPPFFWGPPRVRFSAGISYWPGVYFGFSFGTWSYFDWHHRYIYIDAHRRPKYVRYDRWRPHPGRWDHAPVHRRGVAYRDKYTARKYGQYPHHRGVVRPDTRGFPETRDRDRNRRFDDRTRVDRERQGDGRTRVDRERPSDGRTRVDREKQRDDRAWTNRDQHERDRTQIDRNRRDQLQEAEREVQQRRRDNVFNRVEEGSRESKSSERGRISRRSSGDNASPKGRSGGGNRGDGDHRGRGR